MISRFPHGMIFIWLIKAICNFRLHRFPEEPCSACICGTTTILAKLYDRRSSLTWCSAFDRRARALWPTKLEMWLGKSLGNRYHTCIEEAGLVGIKNGPGIFCALAKFAGVIFSGSFQHVTIIVKIPNFGLWTGNRALLHCKRTGKLRLRALENRTGTDQVHVPISTSFLKVYSMFPISLHGTCICARLQLPGCCKHTIDVDAMCWLVKGRVNFGSDRANSPELDGQYFGSSQQGPDRNHNYHQVNRSGRCFE